MDVRTEELSIFPLLAPLSQEERENLASVLKIRKFNRGAYIIHEDDPAYSLMFVATGRIKISLIGSDGKEIVLALFDEGDFFGELALLTDDPRSANAIAITDTTLYILPRERFEQELKNNPGLSLALLKELARRLRSASEKIGDLALFDVYRRVARTIKNLGTPTIHGTETHYVLAERPTHQELASIVGTSREMVTRALHGLEEDGCIKCDQKGLILIKLPR